MGIVRRTPRRRATKALAAGVLLLGLLAVPPVSAEDLHERHEQVESSLAEAHAHLGRTTALLLEATLDLEAARARLTAAREALARTRGEVVAAVALDEQMQAALDEAEHRLEQARQRLASSKAQVSSQEEVLGQLAAENYQQGDPGLHGLAMVLSSGDPVDLAGQLSSVRTVLDKESATLARLDAGRLLLTVQEEEVREATREVARRRQIAAANLARKRALEKRAEAAEANVVALVAARARAQEAAAMARDADLEMLRELQQERDRISEMLGARAEAARRVAEWAAAAAASTADGEVGSRRGAGLLDTPVEGYITSSYGMRLHPVYKRWNLHDGTDFGAPCGTPVRAAAAGRVVAAYYNAGYGNRVIVDNGHRRGVGLGTAYNHLSTFAAVAGDRVERGEVIGYVGSTGYSTGCHLHFMVFESGVAVDPMSWL